MTRLVHGHVTRDRHHDVGARHAALFTRVASVCEHGQDEALRATGGHCADHVPGGITPSSILKSVGLINLARSFKAFLTNLKIQVKPLPVAVEQVHRHPDHLCLHLPDAGEGVRVEGVGVGRQPVHRGHHLLPGLDGLVANPTQSLSMI